MNEPQITDIMRRESIDCLKYVLNDITLEDFQVIDALTAVMRRKCILGQGTGLGKTYIASAIMKMLLNQEPSHKFLFICKTQQLVQTPKKISDAIGAPVMAISSSNANMMSKFFSGDFLDYKVVIMAEETLNNPEICYVLFKARDKFSGIFVDEAHSMCNYTGSPRANVIRCIMHYLPYAFAMTATPLTSSIDQLSKLLNMLDEEEFPKYRRTSRLLMNQDIDLKVDYPGLYILRNRSELGIPNFYDNHIHIVPPTKAQIGATGKDLFTLCKGEGAYPQVNKLIEILQSSRGKGIVYIRYHATRKFVCKELDKAGIKYSCIYGGVPHHKRKEIMDAYNNDEINLVITSVTSAVDLDGDFLVLYEYTCELRQILGRLERGIIPKRVDIHYIFTQYTDELKFFMQNIYERSLILQNILKNDHSMITEIIEKEEQYKLKHL